MKIILILLFVLIQINVNSQSFWNIVTDKEYYEKSSVSDNAMLGDSIIVVGGYVSLSSCEYQKVFAYNISGQLIWEKYCESDVLFSDSASVYSVGYSIGSDDVLYDEFLNISKLDEKGNVIFENKYPASEYYDYDFEFIPNSIDVDINKNILISSVNSIIKADCLGNVIYEKKYDFNSEITNIKFINSRYYIINTSEALYKSDSSGVILDSIKLINNSIECIVKNDTIFQLSQNSILILDTNLNIFDTIVLSNDIDFYDIQVFDNYLWPLGIKNDTLKLFKLNGVNVSDTLTFKLITNIPHFLISGDNYIFSGTTYSSQIAVCNYNKGYNNFQLPNIDIIDFNIDSVVFDYYTDYNEFTYPKGYYFDTELTIKNSGTDTIRSFAVYSYLHGGLNCSHNIYYQKFSNVHVPPTSSSIVKLRRMYEDGINNNTLCFECMAPNSMIEKDIANNFLCKSFTITEISDDEGLIQSKIYPNPVNDYLNIDIKEAGQKDIALINLNGLIVFHKKLYDSPLSIDLSDIDAGIYFLKVLTEKQNIVQKIIKK